MKRVWVDFLQAVSPARQAFRLALLLMGALVLAYVLFRQHQVSAEQTALAWQQHNLAQLEGRRLPMLHTSLTGEASQESAKRAAEVLRQLNQPWDRLFAALEHAVTPGIHMLAVTPDSHKSSVTIKASAPNTGAALDFIERLQANPALSGVHLVTQEIMVDDKRHPLLFTVSADWKTSS